MHIQQRLVWQLWACHMEDESGESFARAFPSGSRVPGDEEAAACGAQLENSGLGGAVALAAGSLSP